MVFWEMLDLKMSKLWEMLVPQIVKLLILVYSWKIKTSGVFETLKLWNLRNLKLWNFKTVKHWNQEVFLFLSKGIPNTPHHTDSHPCTRPPSGFHDSPWTSDYNINLAFHEYPLAIHEFATNIHWLSMTFNAYRPYRQRIKAYPCKISGWESWSKEKFRSL